MKSATTAIRRRLMNVSQVLVDGTTEFRAQCVEVTQTDEVCVAVLLGLYPSDRPDVHLNQIDPRLVGRVIVPGGILVDAVDGNFSEWVIRSDRPDVLIRPYRDEYVWVDYSFGCCPPAKLATNLADLWEQKRATMQSLIANERLSRATGSSSVAVIEAHQVNINAMRKALDIINERIHRLESRCQT